MAQSKPISYNQIAEPNLLDPLIKQIKIVSSELDKATKQLIEFGNEQSKIAKNTSPDSAENIERLEGSLRKAKKAYEEIDKVEKDRVKLQDRLKQLEDERSQANFDLREQIRRQSKELRDNAKASLDAGNAYEVLKKRARETQLEFKRVASDVNSTKEEVEKARKEFIKFDKRLRAVNKSANDGRIEVGRYSKVLSGLKRFLPIVGVGLLIDKIKDLGIALLQTSQELRGVEFAFNRLGQEGEDAFQRIRNSTRGLVSDLDIKSALVDFDNFNISLEESDTLFEFLAVRAAQTGQNIDSLRDSLVEGLSKESRLRIDNLGISAQELNEELEKTPDFVQAVANIAKREVAEAGDILDEASNSQQRWNAFIDNTRVALSRSLAPAIEAVIGRALDWVGASNKVSDSLIDQRVELNTLVKAIVNSNNTEESRLRLIERLNEEYPEFLQNLDSETVSNEQLSAQLKLVNDELLRKIRLQIRLEEIQEAQSELVKLVREEEGLLKTIATLEERGGRARGAGRANALRRLRENREEQENILGVITELTKETAEYEDQQSELGKSFSNRAKGQQDQERELTGLIEKQREEVRKLNEEKERATGETEILRISREIEVAQQELNRLEELGRQARAEQQEQRDFFGQREVIQDIEEQEKALTRLSDLEIGSLNETIELEKILSDLQKERLQNDIDNIRTRLEFQELSFDEELSLKQSLNDKLIEQDKLRLEEEKRLLEQRQQDLQKFGQAAEQGLQLVSDLASDRSEKRLEAIDKEINAEENRVNRLQELAAQGNEDAQNNLALTEQRQAELELKRQRQIERQQRAEFAFATIQSYSGKVAAGDPNPLASTIADISVLRALINTLPGFYEGTEDTGSEGILLDKEGRKVTGFTHENEKVLKAEHTKAIHNSLGRISNTELTDRVINSEKYVTRNNDNIRLLKEVRELKQITRDKPTYTGMDYDAISDSIVRRIQKGNKSISIHRKIGGIWGKSDK